MSGVVLRCPHCGTSRPSPGECDACHEAAVRYHCTNHAPGRWLASPRCADCGASFGDPPRPAAPHAGRPAPVPARPPAPPTRRPAGVPAATRPMSPAPRTGAPPSPRRPRHEPDDLPEIDIAEFERAARTAPPIGVEMAPVGRALSGCLMRLVMFALLAILAVVVGIFLLGGSLLRLFGLY